MSNVRFMYQHDQSCQSNNSLLFNPNCSERPFWRHFEDMPIPRQSTKFIFVKTSPHPDAFYIHNVKITSPQWNITCPQWLLPAFGRWVIQDLTSKIQVQIHGQGRRWRSYMKHIIQAIPPLLFCINWASKILQYTKLKIWPWKFKDKIMANSAWMSRQCPIICGVTRWQWVIPSLV